MKRNERGDDKLYVGPGNKGYKLLRETYKNEIDPSTEVPILVDGVQGTILIAEECVPVGS